MKKLVWIFFVSLFCSCISLSPFGIKTIRKNNHTEYYDSNYNNIKEVVIIKQLGLRRCSDCEKKVNKYVIGYYENGKNKYFEHKKYKDNYYKEILVSSIKYFEDGNVQEIYEVRRGKGSRKFYSDCPNKLIKVDEYVNGEVVKTISYP